MSVHDEITGARATTRRYLAWAETDAAGHNHFSAAIRWLEEAEQALWRSLGHADMVPHVPRVHLEVDYRARLWFGEEIEVTSGVIRVGRTSCEFGTVVRNPPGEVAIEARHVVVHAPSTAGEAVPWPDEVRAALSATD